MQIRRQTNARAAGVTGLIDLELFFEPFSDFIERVLRKRLKLADDKSGLKVEGTVPPVGAVRGSRRDRTHRRETAARLH